MTEYIEQTSASDRITAAQKAISYLGVSLDRAREVTDEIEKSREAEGMQPVFDARDSADDLLSHLMVHGQVQLDTLRALITPPAVGEDSHDYASRVMVPWEFGSDLVNSEVQGLVAKAHAAGIQSAHETWEPEVAQRPSQEQMLRWLGLDFTEDGDVVIVHRKQIEKEVI